MALRDLKFNAASIGMAFFWLSTSVVLAAPVITVQVSVPGEITGQNHPSNITIEDNIAFPDGRTGSAFARGALHGLGASSSVAIPTLELNPGQSESIATGASTTIRFDDIVITNTIDPANLDPIEVSTNVLLDGAFLFGPGTGLDNALVTSNLTLLYGIGTGPASTANSIGVISRQFSDGSFQETNSGVFAGLGLDGSFTVNDVFETPMLTVPVGTPIRLSLGMVVNTTAVSRNFHTPTPIFAPDLALTADFQNTLTFSINGPALNLPDGYTVDSQQAGIVDNQFTPIPLPLPLLLLGAGCFPLVLSGRRIHGACP